MFLKIIFWLATIFYVLAIIGSTFDVTWLLVDWLSFAVLAIGLVGLYGLAYKKTVGSKQMWYVVTPIIIIYWVLYSFYLDKHFGAYPPKTFGDSLSTMLGGIPLLTAASFYTKQHK